MPLWTLQFLINLPFFISPWNKARRPNLQESIPNSFGTDKTPLTKLMFILGSFD